MKEKEVHLFIIWSKGLNQKEKILKHLGGTFEILSTVEIHWSPEKFSENLSRFYGENLPRNSSKEKHCGTGAFQCILVKDSNPFYELRETSKGIKPVNINMFDAKQLYRDWTSGGHKIHGSDNVSEARSNIYFLFGLKYDDVLNGNYNISEVYKNDLIGAHGWNSLQEIFNAFNELANYVVLRNFANIEDELKNLHPDIDILTDNKRLIADIANGKPTFSDKRRVQHAVSVNRQKVFFDFRFVGDGYYDFKWQQQLLQTRTTHAQMYVPNGENHFFSLMYHVFIHKEKVLADYVHKLIALSKMVGLEYHNTSFINYGVLNELNSFMMQKGYDYTEPRDLTVFFNVKRIEPFKNIVISKPRQKHENIRTLKALIKKILKKLGVKIGN